MAIKPVQKSAVLKIDPKDTKAIFMKVKPKPKVIQIKTAKKEKPVVVKLKSGHPSQNNKTASSGTGLNTQSLSQQGQATRKPVKPQRKPGKSQRNPVKPQRKPDKPQRKPVKSQRKPVKPHKKASQTSE